MPGVTAEVLKVREESRGAGVGKKQWEEAWPGHCWLWRWRKGPPTKEYDRLLESEKGKEMGPPRSLQKDCSLPDISVVAQCETCVGLLTPRVGRE